MSEVQNDMTITDIIEFAEANNCDIDLIACILGDPAQGRFEVQFDYGNANVSYWDTHEEARAEAGRLWATGQASRIADSIVRAASERMSALAA